MVNLGVLYKNGNGVAVDYKKAKEWYEEAAKLGDSDGIICFFFLFFLEYFLFYNKFMYLSL